MMISPTTKKMALLVLCLVVVALIGTFAFGQFNHRATISIAPAPTVQPDSQATMADGSPQFESAPLYLQEAVNSERASLDSRGKKINAITLRMQMEQASVTEPLSFVLDPELAQAGWQILVNDSTAGNTRFELALLAASPEGGMVFDQTRPIGSFVNAKQVKLTIDPTVSLAVPDEGSQLELQLIRNL